MTAPSEGLDPAFDEEAIGRLLGPSPDKQVRFLGLFLERSAPLVEKLRSALRAEDSDAARGLAHQLKSTSASIGGMALSSLAAAIEQDAAEKDGVRAVEHATQLPPLYAATCEAIAARIAHLEAG